MAVTLITTTALISIATFFLSFAALETTAAIARQTLDVILSQCVKLLGLYLVVAAGCQTMEAVARSIPIKIDSFDPYGWLVAVALLFFGLAKTLPNQLAKIVSGAFQEVRNNDTAAMAMAAISYAKNATPALNIAGSAASTAAKIAGSSVFNAGAHFNHAASSSGNIASSIGAAAAGTVGHLGKAVGGHMTEHFKSMASKLSGGEGSVGPIEGIASRMHSVTQNIASGGAPKPESTTLANAMASGFSSQK